MGVRESVAGLAVGLALVTGCSGGSEQPAATMAPSTVPSTPAASSSPDPSQDPLYLEAVGVYKAYFKEMQKFEAAQYPSDTLPKEMDKYMTAEVKLATEKDIQETRDAKLQLRKGEHSVLAAITPNPGASRGGSVISIRVCTDGRMVTVEDSETGEALGPGSLVYGEVFFKRTSDGLKMSVVDEKLVEKCPA